MKILINSMAWLPLADLSSDNVEWLKSKLTLAQSVSPEYKERSKPQVVQLFIEDNDKGLIGIPREFFFENMRSQHEIEYQVSSGLPWPGGELRLYDKVADKPLELRNEQGPAVEATISHLNQRPAGGGLITAPTGWGKSIYSLELIRRMRLKTAVLVHREFLSNQWIDKVENFLPEAKIGAIIGDKWDGVEDAHITMVMIETVVSWVKRGKIPEGFADMFGLIVIDEVHRIGAPMWSKSIPVFNAAYRVGVSAAPRRSDGLEKSFFYHIGPKVFTGNVLRMTPKVRRVWSTFKINHPRLNVNLLSMEFANKLMSADVEYNQLVTDQIKLALEAGRKILVYAHTVKHLDRLKKEIDSQWKGRPIKTDYYIGGMSEDELDESAKADVIFATYKMAADSLDIPTIDTVVLAGPIRNPQQPAGRACREMAGKKQPVVVDMRADDVPILKEYGESRDKVYERLYGEKSSSLKTKEG